jgi:hypothetical protein
MFKSKKFKVCILILLLGNLILALDYVIWVVGLIPVIVGLIITLTLNTIWWKRILMFLSAVVISACIMFSGIYFRGDKAFEEIHFSSNFSGRVRILYNPECGITPQKTKENWDIIEVDNNSVIMIKRHKRRIFTKSKYFLVDEDGNKNEIQEFGKNSDFNGEISVIRHAPGHYKDYDINIQDYTLITNQKDIKTDSLLKLLDARTERKIIDCQDE